LAFTFIISFGSICFHFSVAVIRHSPRLFIAWPAELEFSHSGAVLQNPPGASPDRVTPPGS
jgi:hypothetical protein